MIVLDASVAIKWFVDESDSGKAREILYQLRDDPKGFLVPELFFVEMLSVLSRLIASLPLLEELMSSLEQLGLARIAHGHEILMKACEFTRTYSLSAYDALYGATADLTNATWVTADKQAHEKIEHLGISRLL